MAEKTEWPPFPIALLLAASAVGGIFAAGWALAQVLPALGVAAGLATSITATGIAGAPGAAAWWGPSAALGIGGGGAAGFVWLMVKVVQQAPKEPYKYALPILGVVGSMILDLAKDFAIDNQLLRTLLSAVLAFLIVVAGACYESGRRLWQVVAILLLLSPPVAILARNLDGAPLAHLRDAFATLPAALWIRLAGFLLIGFTVMLLFHLDSRVRRSGAAAA